MLPLACLALAVGVIGVDLVAGPKPSPAERAESTLRDFATAVGERRGTAACALATPALRDRITDRVPGYGGCAKVATAFGVGFDGRVVAAADVRSVVVHGDEAIATDLRSPSGARLNERFVLRRGPDGWRVADTGVTPVTPLDGGPR